MTMKQMKARAELEIRTTARSMYRYLAEGNVESAKTVNTGLLMMILNYTAIELLTTRECNAICNEVENELMQKEAAQ